jgi:O-antigen/teichoic acid export membrane protein
MRVNRLMPRTVRLLTNSHVLGWADQAVVSATSLMVLVMLGRWAGPHELGIYAIGFSIIALLVATQESLITKPYSIQLHELSGASAKHASGVVMLAVMLSVMAAFVTAIAALLVSAFDTFHGMIQTALVLAAAIPFILMREFSRRYAFAHLAVARALVVDLCVAVPTLIFIAALGVSGQLSASNTFAVMGIACGVASIGWFYLMRHQFGLNLSQLYQALQRSWQMGKWFFSSQLAIQIQGYVTPWMILFIVGTIATGIYTACTTIVAFANPLLFGYFNVLLPRFVLTLRQEGVAALRRQACLAALLLAAIMGAFSLIVFAFGGVVMQLLFQGDSYSGYGELLTVLALASFAGSVGVPASLAIAAAGHARRVAGITALTAALHIVLIAVLLPGWGLLGAAYGMLVAEVIGGAGRWIAFLLLAAKIAPRESALALGQPQTSSESPKC